MSNRCVFVVALLVTLSFAGAGLAEDKTEANDQKSLVVELRDGTRVVGSPLDQSLSLETAVGGRCDVILACIDSIEITEGRQALVLFDNADRLQGTVTDARVGLITLWGKVEVPFAQVKRLRLCPADRARSEADRAARAALGAERARPELLPGKARAHLRLVVALRDGGILTGSTDLQTLTLRHDVFGAVDLPLGEIEAVRLGEGEDKGEVRLANGDVVHGVLELPRLALSTSLGPVTLAPAQVRHIAVLPRAGFWSKKGTIIIRNPGAERTAYQVKLIIPSVEGMQTDFDDIRFADEHGDGLSYWIESADVELATVWVKLDHIAQGTSRINMYYGNPLARSASNGDETFLFFDDFQDGFDEKAWERNRDASTEGCGAFVRDGVMHVYAGDGNALGWLLSRVDLPNCITVEGRWKVQYKNRYAMGGLTLCDPPFGGGFAGIEYNYYFYDKGVSREVMASRDSFCAVPLKAGAKLGPYWQDTWFRQRLSYDGTGAERNLLITRDRGEGEEKLIHTARRSEGPLRIRICPWAWYAEPNHRFMIDWLAVRSYAPGRLETTLSLGDGGPSSTTMMDDGPPEEKEPDGSPIDRRELL